MVQLPPLARLIYIAPWTAADDHGLIPDEPERLAMEVMPKEDALVFDDWFQFFEASGRIELLAVEGATFYRSGNGKRTSAWTNRASPEFFGKVSRKVAIPLGVRRKVAEKYGCAPGGQVDAQCYYCGAFGQVHWHKLSNGRPSGWVTFPGLELDHLEPEANGGQTIAENFVLACRSCNRSKGTKLWIEHLCTVNSAPLSPFLPNTREDPVRKGKEQGKRKGTGKGKDPSPSAQDSSGACGADPRSTEADGSHNPQGRAHPPDRRGRAGGLQPIPAAHGPAVRMLGAEQAPDEGGREVLPTARHCAKLYGNERITPKFWEDYFTEAAGDDFHSGRGPYRGEHASWKPDFESSAARNDDGEAVRPRHVG